MKHFTCGRFLAVSSLCTLLLAFAHSALAETYYWTGTAVNPLTDAQFWRVGSPDGAVAETAPGAGDAVVIPGGKTAATEEALPKYSALTIEQGAKLTIPGGAKFKNITLTLDGELELTETSEVTFGYANADETTAFSMSANGGKLTMPASGIINIVCPAKGGTVNVTGAIAITNLTYATEANVWYIGVNNPTTAPFAVDFVGTKVNLATSTKHNFSGAAAVTFGEGALLYRPIPSNAQTEDTRILVDKAASLALKDGGSVRLPVTGNGSGSRVTFNPDAEMTVLTVDGASSSFCPRMQFGNDKGLGVFGDGFWDYSVPGWWGENSNKPFVFYGLKSVELLDGKTLTVRRDFYSWGSNQQEGHNPGNVAVAPVPITGGGSLAFDATDATVNKKYTANFYLNGGKNLATGTLSCWPGRGAMLYLNDGANWAGKVVVNAALALRKATIGTAGTITPDDAAAVCVSVGGLELQDTFVYRVWKTDDGYVNDRVNVGELGITTATAGAMLRLAEQGDFKIADADAGTKFVLGTAPAGMPLPEIDGSSLAPVLKGLVLELEDIDGDDGRKTLVAKVVTAQYNFIAKDSTDLSDEKNWECGYVPVGKDVVILGEGVKAFAGEVIPSFKSITVGTGAELQVGSACALPKIVLAAGSLLSIDGSCSLLNGFEAVLPEDPMAQDLAKFLVAQGVEVLLPGGMTFANVDMEVCGDLTLQSEGDITFGSALAGVTTYTSVKLDGATVKTLGAGNVNFFCPQEGGVAKSKGANFIGSTEFGTNHGFNFGVNNPADEIAEFTVDNTTLDFAHNQNQICGTTHLSLVNGAKIAKSTGANTTTALWLRNASSVTVDESSSFIYGESQTELGSVGGCAIGFCPDEDGFVQLTVNGGTIGFHRTSKTDKWGSNGKAVFVLNGATFRTQYGSWSRGKPFGDIKYVEIGEDGLTIVRTADHGGEDLAIGASLIGAGDVVFENEDTSMVANFLLEKADNACTGLLSSTDPTKAKVSLTKGANWAGSLLWNGGVEIMRDTGAGADVHSFGGMTLKADYAFRLWEDANDVVNLTAGGWTQDGGELVFEFADGYSPVVGDSWDLGSIPKDCAVPEISNLNFRLTSREIDDNTKMLVLEKTEVDFTFDASKGLPITDKDAWACGYVPVGQAVKIANFGSVEIDADAPSFASISVGTGATVQVCGAAKLPTMTFSGDAAMTVDGKDGEVATLNGALAFLTDETGDLPTITINEGASLSVPGDIQFKNCDLRVYGTLRSAGALYLGYALSTETTVFRLTVDGGAISNDSNSALCFYSAQTGGCVTPPEGSVVLLRNADIYTGTGSISFGEGNPVDAELIFDVDRTDIAIRAAGGSGNITAAGGAVLNLRNGSRLYRVIPSSTQGDGCSPTIKGNAKVLVSGFNADSKYDVWLPFCGNGESHFKYNPDAENWTSLMLRDGARYAVWKSEGNGKGVLATSNAVCQVGMVHWWGQRPDFFAGLKAVDIAAESAFVIRREKFGLGDGYVTKAENNDATGDDAVKLNKDVAFTGDGNLVISNTYDKGFQVVVQNGNSSATGAFEVFDSDADNAGKTKAFFADGANWAGTVVWNDNVALGDPAAVTAAPVTVSFGAVDLRADFPIRVWTDENGKVTSDRINITGAGFVGNGGKVVIDFQGGVEPPEGYQFYPLGTMPKDAALPTVRSATWCVKARKIKGDDEHLEYGLVRNRGFIISIY